MKTVKFFYAHTTQDLQVPDDTPVLTSKVDQLTSDRTGIEIVREAMENPIDSPRLCELAKGKEDCVIIISDHTRPVPSRDILPNMIRELREGSPDIKITLLVSTGFHSRTILLSMTPTIPPGMSRSVPSPAAPTASSTKWQ